MNFRKAIWLPVFIFTDEEYEIYKLGLNDSDKLGFNKTEIRPFWTVDWAAEEDDNITAFYCAGESFFIPLSLIAFTRLIDDHLNDKL